MFAFGDAPFKGGMAGRLPRDPYYRIRGLDSTSTGEGYWLVGNDAGVFAFGDARYFGHFTSADDPEPASGIAATSTDQGYWIVAPFFGVVDSRGDASSHGAIDSDTRLEGRIVGISPTKTDQGYWLVGSDGGVFAFGDAPFKGSLGGVRLNSPIVGIASLP